MPVGVVGLGELGTIVEHGVHGAGYDVLGYDPAVSLSNVATAPLVDIARTCDPVLVAVATDDQARRVAGELFAAMRSGTLVLHSTVTPRTPRELAANAPAEVSVVDAPVSIHRDGQARPCVAYLGSDSPVPADVARVIGSYCREVIEVGGLGAGQIVKLVNNVMSLVNTAAAAEALRLAAASGVDPDVVRELVQKGSGASHALATWPHRRTLFDGSRGDARRRALAVKDLDAAVGLGAETGAELPLAGLAAHRLRYLLAADDG